MSSNSVYLKARDACVENVLQYIKDAKKLIEYESYAHAYALLIIGQEELGKAFAYHSAATAEVQKDVAEQIIKLHTKNVKDQKTGEIVKAHVIKLQQYRFLSKLSKLQEAMEKKSSATEAVLSVFSEYREGIKAIEKGDKKELKKQLDKLVAKDEEINRSKMDALYVDVTDRIIKTPLDSRFKEISLKALSELEKTTNLVVNSLFKLSHKKKADLHGGD
jgi:AbiV family abortive infection protein